MPTKNLLLHLSLIEGVGPMTVKAILEHTKSDIKESDFYLFSVSDWKYRYGITEQTAQKIVVGLADTKLLETELFLLEKHKIQLITIVDDIYPALLREIYMPPTVLYCKSKTFITSTEAAASANCNKYIAIVGSRASNAYGTKVVTTIIPELVSAGVTIVSGGALGIDTLAHDLTVKHGGNTIAVLGSGLLNPYPAANKQLFSRIVDSGGTVMSIFSLQMKPLPGNFPARNRVIAGLSHGCVVVQATQKSGALITARYALEQGREVFAVPGPIDDPLSAGCHSLIQQGAQLIAGGSDILKEIGIQHVMSSQKVMAQNMISIDTLQTAHQFSAAQQHIISVCKQSKTLDDIIDETGLDIVVVQNELFTLHIDGLIEQDFTGRWSSLS